LAPCAEIRILPEDLKTVSLVKAWVIRVEFEETTDRLREEIAGRSRVRSGPGEAEEIVIEVEAVNSGVVMEVVAVNSGVVIDVEAVSSGVVIEVEAVNSGVVIEVEAVKAGVTVADEDVQ